MKRRWVRIALGATSATALVVGGLTAYAGTAGAAVHPTDSYTVITEPDDGYQPIYDLIDSAKSTLDMTMYELTDTTAEQHLADAASNGVTVRVILDQNREKSNNTDAYNYLSDHGVQVHWAWDTYAATHQKTITVDGTTSAVMSGNLTSQYYKTSRDFAFIDDDATDVAAIEKVFDADFSDSSITPSDGDDLVWSPTDSEKQLLPIIENAKTSLSVENEEMGYDKVTTALEDAAKRGVDVEITMTNSYDDYATEFDALTAAGAHVHTYPDDNTSLYIHAKVIVADAGSSDAVVDMGSQNFSNASWNENRELGVITTDTTIIDKLNTTLASDYAGGTNWTSSSS